MQLAIPGNNAQVVLHNHTIHGGDITGIDVEFPVYTQPDPIFTAFGGPMPEFDGLFGRPPPTQPQLVDQPVFYEVPTVNPFGTHDNQPVVMDMFGAPVVAGPDLFPATLVEGIHSSGSPLLPPQGVLGPLSTAMQDRNSWKLDMNHAGREQLDGHLGNAD